jgi:hypothetical protein
MLGASKLFKLYGSKRFDKLKKKDEMGWNVVFLVQEVSV